MIDGERGIRKALADVFRDLAVVQRCTLHKKRNILDHRPPNRKAYIARMLTAAWSSDSAALARRRSRLCLGWLENNGESDAAGACAKAWRKPSGSPNSICSALRSFLITTNAIENLIGTARGVSRNVTSWRLGEMIPHRTAVV